MQRRTIAVWAVLLGLAMGFIGNVLFYGKWLGISFPIFMILSIAIILAAARPAQTTVQRRNLWPLLPLVFFSAMVAVRAEPMIMLMNMGAALLLGALTLHYFAVKDPLDEATLPQQVGAVTISAMYAIFGPIAEMTDAWKWLRDRSWRGQTAVSVVRGLAIALPIVIVFTLLLGSADAVFAGYVNDIWEMLSFNPSATLVDQAIITLSIGWLAIGALSYGLARRSPAAPAQKDERYFIYGNEEAQLLDDDAEPEAAPVEKEKPKNRAGIRLGMIESGVILGLVDLLFGVFVLIQLTYFFGGRDAILARGLSYAEYARRGFFELVAVSLLTLGMILWLDQATARRDGRERRLFRALALVIVGLTTIMLISASQRMLLYEEAFGFTHLRVFTHVFMLWLGILFIAFVLSLFRLKRNVFSLGVLVVTIGYLATLNLMNVDLYIAERNIERYRAGQALDLSFLTTLSLDAVPAIVPLHEELEDNPEAQQWTGQWLARHYNDLRGIFGGQGVSVVSANAARDHAWAELTRIADDLPDYDPYFFYQFGSSYYDIYAERSYSSGWDDALTPTALTP